MALNIGKGILLFAAAFFLLTACAGELVTVVPAPSPSLAPAAGPTATPAPQLTVAPTSVSLGTIIPVTPGVPPTPAGPLSFQEIVQQELAKLPTGRMVFNPPNTMEQGVTERIELRLSQNPGEEIGKGLEGRGQPVTDTVKIGTFMSARLTGETGAFDIKALNAEEQVVSTDTFTQWAWDVKPLSYGEQTLHLTITVRIKAPGLGEESRDIPVKDHEIQVNVNPAFVVGQFVGSYWQWLATVIVIPLALWGWRQYSGRNKKVPEGRPVDDA